MIHYSVELGHKEATNCLLKNGAKITVKSDEGFSVSDVARQTAHLDIVNLLATWDMKKKSISEQEFKEILDKGSKFFRMYDSTNTGYMDRQITEDCLKHLFFELDLRFAAPKDIESLIQKGKHTNPDMISKHQFVEWWVAYAQKLYRITKLTTPLT